jgi:hypothetical protein
MHQDTPRISSVSAKADGQHRQVFVSWKSGGDHHRIELAGWIATGGETLAPLADPAMFATAHVAEHGRAIAWGWSEAEHGDLTIDSVHLVLLASEQEPFVRDHLVQWQGEHGLSNQEAADFLSISLSTYNAYKAGSPIPQAIAMVCRAAKRDPILLQVHLVPRKTGRPRKAVS